MKSRNNKIAEAKEANLAASITAREAGAAADRAEIARLNFKRAKKAYKLARKAAKRAAKRAKHAQEKLATFKEVLKNLKPQPTQRKTPKKAKRKVKPARSKAKSVVRRRSRPTKPAPITDSVSSHTEAPADSVPQSPSA